MGTSVNMAGIRFPNLENANGLAAQAANMAGERCPNLENTNFLEAQAANIEGAGASILPIKEVLRGFAVPHVGVVKDRASLDEPTRSVIPH